jgi:hypothetical protein
MVRPWLCVVFTFIVVRADLKNFIGFDPANHHTWPAELYGEGAAPAIKKISMSGRNSLKKATKDAHVVNTAAGKQLAGFAKPKKNQLPSQSPTDTMWKAIRATFAGGHRVFRLTAHHCYVTRSVAADCELELPEDPPRSEAGVWPSHPYQWKMQYCPIFQ